MPYSETAYSVQVNDRFCVDVYDEFDGNGNPTIRVIHLNDFVDCDNCIEVYDDGTHCVAIAGPNDFDEFGKVLTMMRIAEAVRSYGLLDIDRKFHK